MCKEWLNISEIAQMIGISRVTMYSRLEKIDKKVLHSLQIKVKGKVLYNIKIIEILSDIKSINLEKNYKKDYIENLKDEISFLKAQIIARDEQIKLMSNSIYNELKELKNAKKIDLNSDAEKSKEIKRKILSNEEIKNILEDRKKGMIIKELSKKYNSSVGKIHSLIKNSGE